MQTQLCTIVCVILQWVGIWHGTWMMSAQAHVWPTYNGTCSTWDNRWWEKERLQTQPPFSHFYQRIHRETEKNGTMYLGWGEIYSSQFNR